jgi:hypothetical protein
MHQSPTYELKICQLVKKFPILHGLQCSWPCWEDLTIGLLLSRLISCHKLTNCFFQICFNIIFKIYVFISAPNTLFNSGLLAKIVAPCKLSSARYMLHCSPYHLSLRDILRPHGGENEDGGFLKYGAV